MVNFIEMLERLAYYGVRVVIPIYIAQADSPGGLHFTQTDKGIIFAVWALVRIAGSGLFRRIRRPVRLQKDVSPSRSPSTSSAI